MFCPKCGTENPEEGRFCRSCGVDLTGAANIVSGGLVQPSVALSRRGKTITWESAIVKSFMGLAFIGVAIALALSKTGDGWWYWLLIPAFSSLGSGIAQIVQLKKTEKNNVVIAPQKSEQTLNSNNSNLNLPPTQAEYIKPQGSIYDTGEFVAPPSITEATTRHLKMEKEPEK